MRSLLQKSIRQGYIELSQKVAFILASHGDSRWLHARTGIITFEECWPSAYLLIDGHPSISTLKKIAGAIKNKDATGLGTLGYAAAEGDTAAIKQALDPKAVKIIAAALKRPESFFKWAIGECSCEAQAKIVLAAQRFFTKASWPWDKAFMVAGAYLSCQKGVPELASYGQQPQVPFQFWTAVDKHTPQGRIALRQVASDLNIPERQLQWASFYLESAKTQALAHSPWWECEAKWRFATLGLSEEQAEEIWSHASLHIQLAVKKQADHLSNLAKHIDPDHHILL